MSLKEALERLIPVALENFEKIKEWTDLGNWLQKIAKSLESYPTQFIPKKKQLAKRLSQCLIDKLPIGIYKTTLSIYFLIFDNLKGNRLLLAKSIHLLSFGLFSFFPRSSIQIKPEIIELFRKYYLVLGNDLVTLLPGLMTAILPALDEQDNTLQKLIFDFLSDLNKVVGDTFYISTLWLILLKNSKNRLSCFKILNKKFSESPLKQSARSILAPTDEIQQSSLSKEEPAVESYFPNPAMIVNAFIKCLEDEDVIVKKTCLDFIIKNAKFAYQFFPDAAFRRGSKAEFPGSRPDHPSAT